MKHKKKNREGQQSVVSFVYFFTYKKERGLNNDEVHDLAE